MELRHLSGFVAVAEELSFGRAAARLNLSQPAVSRAIAQLEAEIGVALLDRSTHHVGISPAGTAFLQEARGVLSQLEVAVHAARQATVATTLRIVHTECTEELLPPVLRVFRRRLPSVRLDVRQVDRLSQPRRFHRGEIDVALRRAPLIDTALTSEAVGREPLMVAMPAGHPLAAEAKVTVACLADLRFVVLPNSPTHECLMGMCEEAGFVAQVAEEATTLTSLTVLVGGGVGVGLVPASISARFSSREVAYRPLEGDVPTLPVVVGWRQDDEGTATQEFVHAMRAVSVSMHGHVRIASAAPATADLVARRP